MKTLTPETKAKIERIIQDMLGPYGINSCDIKVAEDASGDEAIFIDVRYHLSATEFDAAVINSVGSAVGAMLMEDGEDRFPYIRHRLPSGQKVKAA